MFNIAQSHIHANILQDWLRRTSFLRFILNDKMIWIFYFDTSSYRSIQFQSHQVQLKEPLPEHLKIKKSKSNEQALQRIKCKLNASTNSEITARILQPIMVGSRIRAYQNIKPQEKESVPNSLPQEIE